MGYAKIDHGILTDPKTFDLPSNALALFLKMIVWCSREESDGQIPKKVVKTLGTSRALSELNSRGLVREVPLNWQVVNYLRYQTSSAEVAEKRRKGRERVKAHRDRVTANPSTENRVQSTENKEQSTETRDTPPKSPKGAKRKKPSSAIPDDWQPAPRHTPKAMDLGADLTKEAEKFRNHALAIDRRCVNWDRAFDNWLLNAKPSMGTGTGKSSQQEKLERAMRGEL